MELSVLRQRLEAFTASDEDRAVKGDYALLPELVGIPYFDAPVAGCAGAEDPLFARFKSDPEVIGSSLRLPAEWLPGARSVVSIFFPFSKEIRDSNRSSDKWPSVAWLHARIEGQAFLEKVLRDLCGWLEAQGLRAVVPALSQDFRIDRQSHEGLSPFLSNWSERHAAYIAGLGTFCLSKHLITNRGVCGRFGSVITDAVLDITPRAYSKPFERCTSCGACVSRCPVGAISPELGKDDCACSRFLEEIKERCSPRYGCGKCQLSVPCECAVPKGVVAR